MPPFHRAQAPDINHSVTLKTQTTRTRAPTANPFQSYSHLVFTAQRGRDPAGTVTQIYIRNFQNTYSMTFTPGFHKVSEVNASMHATRRTAGPILAGFLKGFDDECTTPPAKIEIGVRLSDEIAIHNFICRHDNIDLVHKTIDAHAKQRGVTLSAFSLRPGG